MRQLGRYRLDGTLGAGAFATVWKGYDPQLDTPVAIKILAENWALDADVRERFLAEARLLRRIDSPRVIRVYDIGTEEDRPYFVMDYIAGGTVRELVGQAPPRAALLLGAEAAYAVDVLHEAGVVHRDIKPSNLLVDRTMRPPRVLVADLGSAKMLAGASGLTVTTGTPAYMAPEQADQVGGFDGRADVYAVGAVTYELVCGHTPFGSISPAMVAVRSSAERPAPIAAEAGLPSGVDELLTRALDRDPERRPATARELGDALTALAGDRTSAQHRRWPRHDWPVRPVIAAAIVILVLSALITWLILS